MAGKEQESTLDGVRKETIKSGASLIVGLATLAEGFPVIAALVAGGATFWLLHRGKKVEG